jgi:multisubunit Na+/H+ antiporter MnhB subunit
VRQEDVTELIAEGVAIGLSMVALLIVLRSLRQRVSHGRHRAYWIAGVTAVGLALACVGLWIHGGQGGWEPSRLFPYDPLSTLWGHAKMAIGVVIGLLGGALAPLTRRRRDTQR